MHRNPVKHLCFQLVLGESITQLNVKANVNDSSLQFL